MKLNNNFFKEDWLLINVLNIDEIENKVKEMIKIEKPISLDEKSTKGEKSKQYMLYDYFKDNEVLNNIKEEILKNLNYINIRGELILKSAWTVFGYKGSYHTVHRHNNKINHISTVFYLNVPKTMQKSQNGNFYCFLNKENNIEYFSYRPKKGDLIIMPVWILHGVYPQEKGLRQTLNLDFELVF
jgi:hypothetical protein